MPPAPPEDPGVALVALGPVPRGVVRVFLCRHGQTASNKGNLLQGGGADTPLNVLGRHQAAGLGALLRGCVVHLDVVASSHLTRAVATADAVAQFYPGAERRHSEQLGEMLYGTRAPPPARAACPPAA